MARDSAESYLFSREGDATLKATCSAENSNVNRKTSEARVVTVLPRDSPSHQVWGRKTIPNADPFDRSSVGRLGCSSTGWPLRIYRFLGLYAATAISPVCKSVTFTSLCGCRRLRYSANSIASPLMLR